MDTYNLFDRISSAFNSYQYDPSWSDQTIAYIKAPYDSQEKIQQKIDLYQSILQKYRLPSQSVLDIGTGINLVNQIDPSIVTSELPTTSLVGKMYREINTSIDFHFHNITLSNVQVPRVLNWVQTNSSFDLVTMINFIPYSPPDKFPQNSVLVPINLPEVNFLNMFFQMTSLLKTDESILVYKPVMFDRIRSYHGRWIDAFEVEMFNNQYYLVTTKKELIGMMSILDQYHQNLIMLGLLDFNKLKLGFDLF